MPGPRPVLRVGLTGGIASGKTTVAAFFAELGASVIDADKVAAELIEPGGVAHAGVVARFGVRILDESGRIDRPRLSEIVFDDEQARRELEAIVHPLVREEAERRMRDQDGGRSPIALLDAALLVETGAHRNLHRLVVTDCSRESQLERLLARKLTREQAGARLAAQAPREDKLEAADYVIDTDTDLQETRRQTEEVYDFLLSDYELEFSAGG